jgi:hypothetical protein
LGETNLTGDFSGGIGFTVEETTMEEGVVEEGNERGRSMK